MHAVLGTHSGALSRCKGELAEALVIRRGEVLEAFEVNSRQKRRKKEGDLRAPNVRAYRPSCSSKALASFKSAVSKPSVNQL